MVSFQQALNISIPLARREALKSLRSALVLAADDLQSTFDDQHFYDIEGDNVPLGSNSPKYDKWKETNEKDGRRGHKDNQMRRFIGRRTNVYLDLQEGSVTHDLFRTMPPEIAVYAEAYISNKAVGLGRLSPDLVADALIICSNTFRDALEKELAVQGWNCKVTKSQ